MKYCCYCGKEIPDDAQFCIHCGKSVSGAGGDEEAQNAQVNRGAVKKSEVDTLIEIFLLIACIVNGIASLGIALAWCIPMRRSILDDMKNGVPVSIAMKVCTLLFVNTIAGILLFCRDEFQ